MQALTYKAKCILNDCEDLSFSFKNCIKIRFNCYIYYHRLSGRWGKAVAAQSVFNASYSGQQQIFLSNRKKSRS